MNKIIVIGCPGSGKSTLSTKLGKKLNIPVHHLDDYQDLPSEEFKNVQSELMKGDRWILDGNFTKTIDSRASNADTVILIEFSRRVVIWRAVKRYFKDFKNIIKNFSETWGVLKYIWNFSSSEIMAILEKHRGHRRVLVLHNQKEVKDLLG